MLILGRYGIIRSLSRVLLEFVLGMVFDVGALCECGVFRQYFVYLC